MSSKRIEAKEESIGTLLKNRFYIIPPYQREYAWKEKQVDEFFKDILSHFLNSQSPSDDYFLGSIITYAEDKNSPAKVIDGQQRLTTILILLCAIRDFLLDNGFDFPRHANELLLANTSDQSGKDVICPRIDIHYEDGKTFLNSLIKGENVRMIRGNSESIKNLKEAYEYLLKELEDNFDTNYSRILEFIVHIKEHTAIIYITTDSISSGLKMFETINARGSSLTSSDLIKNLIFMRASDSEIKQVELKWNQLSHHFKESTKSLVLFLKEFCLSQFPRGDISEDDLFSVFSDPSVFKHWDNNVIRLLDDLNMKANIYVNLKAGKDWFGEPSNGHKRIQAISDTQSHICLLLASSTRCPDLYDSLIKNIEDLLLCLKVRKKSPQHIQYILNNWRKSIIETPDQDLNKLITRVMRKEIDDQQQEFYSALSSESVKDMPKKLRRYILARIYAFVEQEAWGKGSGNSDVLKLTTGFYQEEHCLPQSPTSLGLDQFGIQKDQIESYVWRLGNLLLIESPLNGSCSNKLFKVKKDFYRQSNLLLTKIIYGQILEGSNNQVVRALSGIDSFSIWNEQSIATRLETYKKILGITLGWNQTVLPLFLNRTNYSR